MTRPDFATPLLTIDAAKAWIKALHDADLMFHFEDSPDTIINIKSDERIFTDEEAPLVRQRIDELYALDWSTVGHECPIGYALEVMGHVIDDEPPASALDDGRDFTPPYEP